MGNQILQDVNGAISLVQTTVNAINTVFLAFQTTQDAGIADISSAVDTIAAEFVLGMKGVVAEAMLGSSLTFGAIECTAWEGTDVFPLLAKVLLYVQAWKLS